MHLITVVPALRCIPVIGYLVRPGGAVAVYKGETAVMGVDVVEGPDDHELVGPVPGPRDDDPETHRWTVPSQPVVFSPLPAA